MYRGSLWLHSSPHVAGPIRSRKRAFDEKPMTLASCFNGVLKVVSDRLRSMIGTQLRRIASWACTVLLQVPKDQPKAMKFTDGYERVCAPPVLQGSDTYSISKFQRLSWHFSAACVRCIRNRVVDKKHPAAWLFCRIRPWTYIAANFDLTHLA